MKLIDHIRSAFDDAGQGKFDSAMLHACVAVDTTSKRLHPTESRVGKRYVACLRNYYWLIEPMLGAGINLDETRFENVTLSKNTAPDFAEIVYEVFRCNHAHGDEVPNNFVVTPTATNGDVHWSSGINKLHLPETLLWALLALVVFSKANAAEKTEGSQYLSLWGRTFPVAEWWGREGEFKSFVESRPMIRIAMNLASMKPK